MSTDEGPAAVQAILQAIEGNANFWHIREFKRHDWLLADGPASRREAPVPLTIGGHQ